MNEDHQEDHRRLQIAAQLLAAMLVNRNSPEALDRTIVIAAVRLATVLIWEHENDAAEQHRAACEREALVTAKVVKPKKGRR